MSARRVVITGSGWVTPLGADVASVWSKLLSGATAMGPVRRFDAETFATSFAAEVKDFDLFSFLDSSASRHSQASLAGQFALAAAAQAWVQAGLGSHDGTPAGGAYDPDRVGVYLGAGEGEPQMPEGVEANVHAFDASARTVSGSKWTSYAEEHFRTQAVLEEEPQMAVAHVAAHFNCRGPALNCMTACAASTQSVGEAFEIIRRGDADAMLAGGAHSMIHPLGMTGFIRLTAMSTRKDEVETACRPFDRTRDGFVMGEGAGMVVLEDLEHAKKRGANILAELVGYGSSADAYRITDIKEDGGGAIDAMRRALRQAGITPTEPDEQGRAPVQYVSAHGTGTQENDGIETKAIKGVFGSQAPRVPFSSVKSMLGHLIQAAGAVELITCVKAIETGFVPPTMNLRNPDPECDLDYVPNEARDLREQGGVDVAMSNGFGFGGQNDCVVIRRFAE
ncbi:MAG: beta-ketoacyl-[acyl-carrier-protein] synthase family protein [Planctomycetota bacterium]